MKRGLFLPWLFFGMAALVLLGAGASISRQLVILELARTAAEEESELEEKVRTALWRMDSYVAPLLAAESAWPRYGIRPPRSQEAPTGWESSRLIVAPEYDAGDEPAGASPRYARLIGRFPAPAVQSVLFTDSLPEPVPGAQQQVAKLDYANRATQNFMSQQAVQMIASNAAVLPHAPAKQAGGDELGSEPVGPFWEEKNLVIAARVEESTSSPLRVSVIQWAPLQTQLNRLVRDLLPGIRLLPGAGKGAYQLASIPVHITFLREPPPGLRPEFSKALASAWGGMLLGLAALGLLLGGVLSLSERRHRFVSAVTHELRTPLTTFQLYSEMLRDGMVPEENRGEYLETLRRESIRLQHLVENVLAYARLERRDRKGLVRPISLKELVHASEGRLRERSSGAGMELEICVASPESVVHANPGAVDQILFNLVDNACKYAGDREDRRIRLVAHADARWASLQVSDSGPGFPASRRRLIAPFSVSAEEAAQRNKPGVGLGLELSRQLARAMRGRLLTGKSDTGGACVTLLLRREAPG